MNESDHKWMALSLILIAVLGYNLGWYSGYNDYDQETVAYYLTYRTYERDGLTFIDSDRCLWINTTWKKCREIDGCTSTRWMTIPPRMPCEAFSWPGNDCTAEWCGGQHGAI
jgi:hypothetical protein